jgi:endoglucanase
VRVNEVGYLPLGEKYAYVAGFPEVLAAAPGTRFEVRRAKDDSLAYAGVLTLVDEHEQFVSGEEVLRADFSQLMIPGRYYVSVAGSLEPSPVFEIDWRIYKPVLRDALRYYFYARQGIAIEEPFAEGFPRPLGNPSDATALMRSNGTLCDVSHGWYDAGDCGKYVPAAAEAG